MSCEDAFGRGTDAGRQYKLRGPVLLWPADEEVDENCQLLGDALGNVCEMDVSLVADAAAESLRSCTTLGTAQICLG